MQILSQDAIAAATSDLLVDAALGWELIHQMEQDSKEMLIDDGPADDEIDEWVEDDPHYVMFQQSSDFYASVLPQEQREDWIGE